MLKRKLRLILWPWHRRIGLMAAFFILMLSITGVLLNHSYSLGLSKNHLSLSIAQLFYGIEKPDIISFNFKGDWISQVEGGQLYFGTKEFIECKGYLVGVANYDQSWLVACNNELLVFTADGELIERIGKQHGLPLPMDNIGYCTQQLCLQSEGISYQLDIDQLTWRHTNSQESAKWSLPGNLPNNLRDTLVSFYIGPGINWERFLLDLHSGRLCGDWGVYLMDFMAILFIILGLSGVLIWFTKK